MHRTMKMHSWRAAIRIATGGYGEEEGGGREGKDDSRNVITNGGECMENHMCVIESLWIVITDRSHYAYVHIISHFFHAFHWSIVVNDSKDLERQNRDT